MKAAILKLTWLLSSYQSWKNNLPVFLLQDQDQEVKMDDGGRDDYLDPIFPGQREGCLHASRGWNVFSVFLT